MSSDRAFEGPDLIDVLDEAVRQNEFLIGELETWARGMASVAGAPSSGDCCVNSVMWAAVRHTSSLRKPSISGGSCVLVGVIRGRPGKRPSSARLGAATLGIVSAASLSA